MKRSKDIKKLFIRDFTTTTCSWRFLSIEEKSKRTIKALHKKFNKLIEESSEECPFVIHSLLSKKANSFAEPIDLTIDKP